MSVTWDDVVAIDAYLADVPVATQDAILADCVLLLDATRFGSKLDLATKYLAAHTGILYKRTGAGPVGPVTSQSLGPASVGYAAPVLAAFDDLSSTPWGLRFELILTGTGLFGVTG